MQRQFFVAYGPYLRWSGATECLADLGICAAHVHRLAHLNVEERYAALEALVARVTAKDLSHMARQQLEDEVVADYILASVPCTKDVLQYATRFQMGQGVLAAQAWRAANGVASLHEFVFIMFGEDDRQIAFVSRHAVTQARVYVHLLIVRDGIHVVDPLLGVQDATFPQYVALIVCRRMVEVGTNRTVHFEVQPRRQLAGETTPSTDPNIPLYARFSYNVGLRRGAFQPSKASPRKEM